jgi:hypothetical protein
MNLHHSLFDPKNKIRVISHDKDEYVLQITCKGWVDDDTVIDLTVSLEEYQLAERIRSLPLTKEQRDFLTEDIEKFLQKVQEDALNSGATLAKNKKTSKLIDNSII